MKNTFKISIALLVVMFSCPLIYAQKTENKLSKILLGKDKEVERLQLTIGTYPFLFFGGIGGSLGAEFNHWHTGLIGFTVQPPEFIKTTFFRNADDITIEQNYAVELFANYYLRPDRKGLYFGIVGGPEWFEIKDNITAAKTTIIKSYVVPNVGVRLFPFKKFFYTDASIGWSFNLSGTENQTLGATTFNASRGGLLYFFQLGARFPLAK